MLKEEELEKKRLMGVGCFKRQASETNSYMKIPKISSNDENTMYKVPIVCIFIINLSIKIIKKTNNLF